MYVLVETIFMVSLVELLANARVGAQFINGATTASCTSLSEPGFTAQTSPSPYFLLLSQDTYRPGGTIEVTLQSSQTQVNSFTAIIFQARRSSGESFPVGRFDIQGLADLQYVTCTDVLTQRISTDGTVTNVDEVSKSLPMVLSWVAPDSSVGDVVFVTTVVRSNGTFWEAVQSQVLSATLCPSDTTVSSANFFYAVSDLPLTLPGNIVITSGPTPAFVQTGTTQTVTYTFSDGQNCSFDVTVVVLDSPPVVACIDDVVQAIPLGAGGTVVFWTEPTATDESGIVSLQRRSHAPGSFFTPGSTTVTYTFIDSIGNTADFVFSVIVIEVDEVAPVVSCITGVTKEIPLQSVGAVVEFIEPTVTDNSGIVSLQSASHRPGDFFLTGTTTVTYAFVDPSGNTASCMFDVIVIEDGASTDGILCPRRAITMNSQEILTPVDWKTPIIHTKSNGETIALRQESSFDSGLQFPLGATEVIYGADEAICRFWVIINDIGNTTDVTPPTIYDCPKAPLKYEINRDQISFTPTWKEPFAIDDSCLPVVNQSSHSSGDQLEIGNTTVVFNYTDSANNSAQCVFVISVNVIDVTVPSPEIVFCPASIRYNLAAFVHEVNITWSEPVIENFLQLHQTHFSGDTFNIGTTVVTYTAISSVGEEAICSFSVDVRDVTPPRISRCPSEKSVRACRGSARVTWLEPTAEDNSGFQIQQIQSHIPGESVFREGTKTVGYAFEDIFGNTAVCSFNITVHRNSCRSITQTMISFYIYIALGLLLFLFFILTGVSCYIDKHSGSRRDNDVNNLSLQELTT